MALITHGFAQLEHDPIRRITARVKARGNTLNGTVEEQLELIRELDTFPLGRFLLRNRGGLNGRWTDYVVSSPLPPAALSCELERFLIYGAPNVLATRERFAHYQASMQAELPRVNKMASIPCGRMADLLTLDYHDPTGMEIVGIDLDKSSLQIAGELAELRGLAKRVRLRRADAWRLKLAPEFDLITTNGLTIYESSGSRVADLYRRLSAGLVPGGLLVTSYLTAPPTLDSNSLWDVSAVDFDALRLQSLIFRDICDGAWMNFRGEAELAPMFEDAGLRIERTIWDTVGAFPTVLLRKV